MSWSSHNKYRITGSITSGLSLSEINADNGSLGSIGWTLYDSINYSAGTYSPDAYYEGIYDSGDTVARKVQWTATGSIYYQYATSSDGISYSSWETADSAISTKEINIPTQYFKIRFIFDGINWSGNDSVYVYNIQPYFQRFVKGTLIDANQVNGNFSFVGTGDWLPAGGVDLVNTTGVYDIGEDIYKWSDVYINNINSIIVNTSGSSQIGSTLYLIDEFVLSSQTSRIDFSGLNGDESSIYELNIMLRNSVNSSSSFKMFFNGDSSTNYSYQDANGNLNTATASNQSTVSGIYLGELQGITVSVNANINIYIYSKTGNYRTVICDYNYNNYTTVRASTGFRSFSWANTSDTITSIQICSETETVIDSDSVIKLWGTK